MGNEGGVIPKEIRGNMAKLLQSNAFKILVSLICIIIALLSLFVFKMGEDNPVEQIAEEIIKIETGVDVDFTPKTGGK